MAAEFTDLEAAFKLTAGGQVEQHLRITHALLHNEIAGCTNPPQRVHPLSRPLRKGLCGGS